MDELNANLAVMQTGGPRPAINAVLAGIVLNAGKHSQELDNVYGIRNGPQGLLNEELVDLLEEKQLTIQHISLLNIPALGTSLFGTTGQIEDQLTKHEDAIFTVLAAHQIRYMIVIGGIEAARIAWYFHTAARNRGYALMVNAVPVSAGNELPFTEHSLGFGSYVRQGMLLLRMIERDLVLRPRGEVTCCVIETGGWNSGWESLGPACLVRYAHDVPIMALIPEVPLEVNQVAERVVEVIRENGSAIVLVPDGMREPNGTVWAQAGFGWDYFNQSIGPSAGAVLAEKIQQLTRKFVARLRLPVWCVGGPVHAVRPILMRRFEPVRPLFKRALTNKAG